MCLVWQISVCGTQTFSAENDSDLIVCPDTVICETDENGHNSLELSHHVNTASIKDASDMESYTIHNKFGFEL